MRARGWTRRPRRPTGHASRSCARSSNRPAIGRMTSARRGPGGARLHRPRTRPRGRPRRSRPAHRLPGRARAPERRARGAQGRAPDRHGAARTRRASRTRGPHGRNLLVSARPRAGVRPSVRGACAAAGHGGDHAHRRRRQRTADRCGGGDVPRGAARATRRRRLDLRGVRACLGRAGLCARSPASVSWAADRAARRGAGPHRHPLRRDPRARARRAGPGVRGRARTGGRGAPSGGEPAGSRRAPAAQPGASRAPLPARAPRPAARVPAAALHAPQPAAPAHQLRRARAGARRAGGAARRRPPGHADGRRRLGKDAPGDRGRRQSGRTDARWRLVGRPGPAVRPAARRQGRRRASSACASGRTAICSATSSSACASPSSCSCSTTASTWSTLARGWRRRCCAAARSCACWRRAASRLGVPGERGLPHGFAARSRGRRRARRDRRRPRGDPVRRSRSRGARRLRADAARPRRWWRQVCRRLDGLPLAIELAAARARRRCRWTTSQRAWTIASALLTGGARTALPRQRTLEATVDWSYDLLSERRARAAAIDCRCSRAAGRSTLPRRCARQPASRLATSPTT